MREATFEVRIMEKLLDYGFKKDDIQGHVIERMVLSLFKDGRISSGKAAQLLEVPRIEFLALLRQRGVAYVDYSPVKLAEELAAVKALPVGASS